MNKYKNSLIGISASNRLISGSEIMILILFCTIYFYYIAPSGKKKKMIPSHYISQIYLFAVACNVGYLKRFAGL
jgi:hypothetical protein